jgi:N4-gp56 family major capsid protein
MTWTLDAPAGVYKDHALSARIREAAIADAQFMRFVRPEGNFGKGRGQSITITRVFPLPKATRVSELDRLPSGRPVIDTLSIEVNEWGFKIPMTEFERNLTHYDISNQFQRLLRDQMRLTMDDMVADAFKTTPIKYTPQAAGGVFSTNGVPGAQADKNLGITDLRVIHDELNGELKAPKFRNGKYVGILSTKAARGIKNDPEYKDWQAPTTSGPFLDARLRDVEGFMLIETNHQDALAQALGLGGVMGEAVFFGADPVVLATVDEPELRAGLPEDLGRFRDVGWVGTLEAGLVWDVADHARVIHAASDDS